MTFEQKTRKITERSIENAAHFYLQRFASSAENLKRVLTRKVRRAAAVSDTDRNDDGDDGDDGRIAEGAVIIERVISRFVEAGLLDDFKYAEGRAASLHRRGVSAGRIRQHLAHKGVAAEAADHALAALAAERAAERAAENGGEIGGGRAALDLAAAVNLARRRRLGPFRAPSARPGMRAKDLAVLARAGFGYHLAVQVIDAAGPDALMDLM
jgi:regulatory protein